MQDIYPVLILNYTPEDIAMSDFYRDISRRIILECERLEQMERLASDDSIDEVEKAKLLMEMLHCKNTIRSLSNRRLDNKKGFYYQPHGA